MYIGIDVGGSNIRVASFSDLHQPQLLGKKSFAVNESAEVSISQVAQAITELAVGKKVRGIGIALPGMVNTAEGVIEISANLPTWEKQPIKKSLADHFANIKITCEQDTAAGALGEARYGAGKNKEKFVFLIWGTGFGGAVVESRAAAQIITPIQIGHQVYDWNGPQCPCGQNGCFEIYIGGGSLKKLHGLDPEKITDSAVWEDLAQKAAHAVMNMIMNQQVELIVFSGGLVSKQPHLLPKIEQILKERMMLFPTPQLSLAQLGEDAGLYGAIGALQS